MIKKNRINTLKTALFSLILLISLSGCSVFVRRDIAKEQMLLNHLQGWQAFSLDGIVEITLSPLRLRKNIRVSKTEESLNISIFDSGIFGMRPTPLLSIVVDTTLTMNLPPDLQKMMDDTPSETDLLTIDKINGFINRLMSKKTVIVRDKKLQIDKTEFFFNDSMQIARVRMGGDENLIELLFQYRRDDLHRISFIMEGEKILEITADRIRYG